MFLYMPIDDRTSLSVSSVMAVGFGIGNPIVFGHILPVDRMPAVLEQEHLRPFDVVDHDDVVHCHVRWRPSIEYLLGVGERYPIDLNVGRLPHDVD